MERVEWLKRELEERGLDSCLVLRHQRYFSGTSAGAAFLLREGDPLLFCSEMEAGRARKESRLPILSYGSEPSEELWRVVGRVLREGRARRVAYDEASPSFLRKLKREAGGIRLQKFRDFFGKFCERKTKKEIEWMKKATDIALRGLRCASELMEEGRSEREIAAEVEYEMRKAGSEGTPFPTIVASGRNSLFPHASSTSKKLRKGELVVVDLGASYRGYSSDLTRTFALSPSQKQEKLLEAVREAQLLALKEVRAGKKAEEVEKAARKALEGKGYGKYLLHGTGHGIGLEVHEPPSLRRGSKEVLKEDSVITVEPGAYVPGVGGARWEDMVVVKKEGALLLSGDINGGR